MYLGQIEDPLMLTSTAMDLGITTAENSPALRNTSLVIRSVGIELGIHTIINKFWTSSCQASHESLSFAKKGSSIFYQGSSSPLDHRLWVLGIDMGHYMAIVRAPGFWNRISQRYAEG